MGINKNQQKIVEILQFNGKILSVGIEKLSCVVTISGLCPEIVTTLV